MILLLWCALLVGVSRGLVPMRTAATSKQRTLQQHHPQVGRRAITHPTLGLWSASSGNSNSETTTPPPLDNNDNADGSGMRVGIVGAGAIALATAALLHQAGHEAMLWSPRATTTTTTSTMPVTVSGKVVLEQTTPTPQFTVRTAPSAATLVSQNEVIMLCLPANGHRVVMDALAPHLRAHHVVLISSHASFGALYLSQLLHARGPRVPAIGAWGTTVATARRGAVAQVCINTVRTSIDVCTIPSTAEPAVMALCTRLFPQIAQFVPRDGLLAIALSNLNPQNHLGIAVGNMSRMERGENWYQSLHITPAIGRLLQDLDAERLAIAAACGVTVKTIFEHFSWSFHVPITDSISDMNQEIHRRGNDVLGPPTADSRYILEDVPFGLVPTIVLGRLAGRPAVLHEAGVLMISSMYGRDFYQENDLLQALNIEDLEQLRQAFKTGILKPSSKEATTTTTTTNQQERAAGGVNQCAPVSSSNQSDRILTP